MMLNPEQADNLMRQRRSVFPKDYTKQVVPDSIIKVLLENANWAPTHKLTQPWRFVVFCGNGLKKLADFQSECYRSVATAAGNFQEDRFRALQTKPFESSHIIAVGMKRDEDQRLPEWEELGAVFCAVQNMYLTATAYGLGSYLSTGGITNFEEAKPFFGLGPADKLCGFFHVGIPKALPVGGKRSPIEEKTIWVTD